MLSELLIWPLIVAIAALLAGFLTRTLPGRGLGFLGGFLVGIPGAILGIFLLGMLLNLISASITLGFFGTLVLAIIGACALAALVHSAVARRQTAQTM